MERAIVVGASSGIGAAIVRRLAKDGAAVAILARREIEMARLAHDAPERLHPYFHDVRNTETAPDLFERIEHDLGGVDTLVYAAGVMPRIAINEYAFVKDREMVEVNVLGAMAWMNLAAARFEAARSGTIIGISSIAGERGRRGNPAYCASKAALTTYLEALRNRCSRFGVNVVTVKPGFVDTDMTRGLPGLFWLISAEEAARLTLALARRGSSASGHVPERWRLVALMVRLLPSFIFRRLSL
ncbi:MAG: SDR family NAD(P)-dependent oxidoreductase [Vicinamibacteria bacterium]|nr:SDR family NAD(P)-dependent oxidoreductase [Vicinamibacteria bacterium]